LHRADSHRSLAREGGSFTRIVDAVRTGLAGRYLDGGRKVGDVATLLEFSTVSGFSHWYRRRHHVPSARRAASGGRRHF